MAPWALAASNFTFKAILTSDARTCLSTHPLHALLSLSLLFYPPMQDIWNACIFTAYTSLALRAAIILFGVPFVQCVPRVSPIACRVLSQLILRPNLPAMRRTPPSWHFSLPYIPYPPPCIHARSTASRTTASLGIRRQRHHAERPLDTDIRRAQVSLVLNKYSLYSTGRELAERYFLYPTYGA
jgi:hypothetical protein